jgi:hypothetical protein
VPRNNEGSIGDYISHDTDCFFTYSLKAVLASEGLLISSPVDPAGLMRVTGCD